MKQFFQEFWLWILVPFVVVLGGLGVLMLMVGEGSLNDFVYSIF
ncbi:MAG: hypothetical protein WD226_07755 [Planctomycetota bacterium]